MHYTKNYLILFNCGSVIIKQNSVAFFSVICLLHGMNEQDFILQNASDYYCYCYCTLHHNTYHE